jgi:hypothetical protein
MRCLYAFSVLGLLVGLGCGRNAPESRLASEETGPAGAQEKPEAAPEQAKAAPRRIIYTAQLEVLVDDFDQAQADLVGLVKERDGYVAKSDVRGTPGTPRSGTWTVRVPAARFEEFLSVVARLGELRHSTTDSNDITDAYYDLQARIKNDQAREEALRKLYQEKIANSKLEELLTVDRELSAVRGKIETQTGQLQRWDKETAYSTAVVTLRDRKDYVPPVVPDFGTSVGRTFQASVETLVGLGKFLVLAAAALAPWLPVLAVLLAPAWLWERRRRRRAAAARPAT